MKKYVYSFSIDPKLWHSNKLIDVQEKLEESSLETNLGKPYNEDLLAGAASDEIHTTQSYHLTNGDIVKFKRLNNEAFDLLQVELVTRKSRIPLYLQNMLKKLDHDMNTHGMSGYQTNVPDISKKMFE